MAWCWEGLARQPPPCLVQPRAPCSFLLSWREVAAMAGGAACARSQLHLGSHSEGSESLFKALSE